MKPLSSILLILLLYPTLASPLQVNLVNKNFQSQISPPEGFGPYQVGWIDVNISVTGNKTLPIALYYPSLTGGEGSDPNMTDSPYPTMLFSLGYSTTIDNYRLFASVVASWGFVFTLVGSSPTALDSERASDVINTLNWLEAQNTNSSFKLKQALDISKFGVAGHSLGSEAAVTVARSEHRFKILICIAPFTVAPGSTTYVNVPILILVGSADTITPANIMAYPLYQNGNNPKFCITLIGDNHWSIIFTCTKYVTSFLKFYFNEDWNYATFLYGFEAQKEVETKRITLMYDLRKTFRYEVMFKEISYNISVYSDSFFQNFYYSEFPNRMNFTFSGPPYTSGTANVSIPKKIVENYIFEVYLDSEPYPFNLTSNLEFYFVYLSYNHSMHQLIIEMTDITPPTLSIISPTNDLIINSPNVTLIWTSEDAASGLDYFNVKIDENTWLTVDNATSCKFINVNDGAHVVYVKAVDKAGNSNETFVSFKVDTTPPTISIISPNASITSSPNVTIIWSGFDAVSGINHYEIKLNNGSWINVGNTLSYVYFDLNNGNHTVYVKAVDDAGNSSETFISFAVLDASTRGSLNGNWWFWVILIIMVVSATIAIFYLTRQSSSIDNRSKRKIG